MVTVGLTEFLKHRLARQMLKPGCGTDQASIEENPHIALKRMDASFGVLDCHQATNAVTHLTSYDDLRVTRCEL